MMVRRSSKGRDDLTDQQIADLARQLSSLYHLVCRVHVELQRDCVPRLRNITFLNALHEYADGITGRQSVLYGPPHSSGSGFVPPVEEPKGEERLRLRHLPNRPPYPFFELSWPSGGSIKLIYCARPGGFRGESYFAHQREAEQWAKFLARAVRDELERRGL